MSAPPGIPPRTQMRSRLTGEAAVREALDAGRLLRVLLCRESQRDRPGGSVPELLARARAAGVRVRAISDIQLARLSGAGAGGQPPELLAMLGPDPKSTLSEMLGERGAAWLLTGTAYPGNAGFAIRTAELSGADGIVIDAAFTHAQRRDARRAAMRADRFLSVHYAPGEHCVALARAAGRRIVAIEDTGRRAPWETDLLVSSLFVVGGERSGIAAPILDACDEVLRLPMPGFMPSYNLQAAMAAVALERLRQLERSEAGVDAARLSP